MKADPEVLRRLADEIERLFGEGRRDASAMIGSLVYSNMPAFLAALRAPQNDGAAAMRDALKVAQSALAMLTEPKEIRSTSVANAWAIAVDAELKCRRVLAQPDPSQEPGTGGER